MAWRDVAQGKKHDRLPFFIKSKRLHDQRFGTTHEVLSATDLLDPDIVTIDDLPLIATMRDMLQQAIDDGDAALSQQIQDLIDDIDGRFATANDTISQLQAQIDSFAAPIAGQTTWFDNRYGKTVNDMRQKGWVVEDGTTVEAQLVALGFYSLDDLAFTGVTENLIDPYLGRGGLFVRAGAVAGVAQTDQMQGHRHGPSNLVFDTYGGFVYNSSSFGHGTGSPTTDPISDGINGTPMTGFETRPVNITRIPMIYAIK